MIDERGQQETRGNEGVVDKMTIEEGPAVAQGDTSDGSARRVDDRDATAAETGTSYVLDAGGAQKTTRVADVDGEGNVVRARVGRMVVRDDGLVAFQEARTASPAERNAAELAELERRARELRGEA